MNVVAAENPEFILVSFDVSRVFAKGMAFEEFSALRGQDIRKVEFDVPKVDIECLRQLPDFKDFDPAKEALTMLKPIYGLKDALRAWRKKFHQVFVQWLSCRQFYIEPECYYVHKKDLVIEPSILVRAKEHNEEQHESGKARQTEPQVFEKGNVQCLSSAHVDDIKGTAARDVAESLLKRFKVKVGQCKAD